MEDDMHARVTWLEGSPGRAGEAVSAIRDQALPLVRDAPGFRQLLFLVDRSAGRAMAITLWDTAEDRDATDELANRLRNLPIARWSTELPERFEVLLAAGRDD
jgi:hypothetical protein